MGEKGYLNFDYSLSPSVEFVLNQKLSVGGGISFIQSTFECGKDNNERYPNLGSVDIIGYSLFMKSYKAIAPLGYYYKFQADYFTYSPNLIWRDLVNLPNGYWGYETREYIDKGWNLGFKIEYGKLFFISDYFEIGAGCSLGLAFKGWGSAGFDNPTIPEYVDMKIRKIYTLGINLNIGILPF